MKVLRYDYYRYKNVSGLKDEIVDDLVRTTLKKVFEEMDTCPYRDFTGNIRIGIFHDDVMDADDTPVFEFEFTSDPDHVMSDVDLDRLGHDRILSMTFDALDFVQGEDAPFTYFGLVQVALVYKSVNGVLDTAITGPIYRGISEQMRKYVREKAHFLNFKTDKM